MQARVVELEQQLALKSRVPVIFGKNSVFQNDLRPFESDAARENWLRQLNRSLNDMKPNLIWFFSSIFPLMLRGGEAFKVVDLKFVAPRGLLLSAEWHPKKNGSDRIKFNNISGRLNQDTGFIGPLSDYDQVNFHFVHYGLCKYIV